MEPTTHAPRQLGLTSATALVVATMVGTGIFTTSGLLLADLHEPWAVMVVWVVGAIFAALGALCYGALSRAIPESGGEYLFVSRTIHPSIGSVVGWVTLPAGFAAPLAASAYAFGAYVAEWLPAWHPQLPGTLLILAFSILHATNVRRGAWTQNAGVLLNLALIVVFIVLALPRSDMPPVSVESAFLAAPFSVYAVSLTWVSYSFFGWNSAAYIGGEVLNPTRNLPRAMLLGTAVVALLYLGLNMAFLGSAPVAELAGKVEIGRVAARAFGGVSAAEIVTVVVVLVLTTSVSSFVMAGPRVYAKMAEDGYMPAWMRPSGGRPPAVSIWIQSVVALVILWTATFDGLLTYIGFTLSFANAATIVGLIVLRRARGVEVRVPGWPWVPVLFLAIWSVMAVLTFRDRPLESLTGLATLALGLVFWRISVRAHARRGSGA
ncbi:MAG TPA: amino acid permease [Opitutaceae bacterium]|nr:amino acid permease [Opitutaceae bacterium]